MDFQATTAVPPVQPLLLPAVQKVREAAASTGDGTHYKITFGDIIISSYQTGGSS